MIAVATVALLLSLAEWLDRWQLKHLAHNASEWGRYYEEAVKKERIPKYRQDYTEWQRAMEYYSTHPAEHPMFMPWSPWRPHTARAGYVGIGGAPDLSRSK
jgi:hypothetical protein